MIEISNEELAKVLNLWTETDEWGIEEPGKLICGVWVQRMQEGLIVLPCSAPNDQEAHALVTFMLKERKYPENVPNVFYPVGKDAHEKYVKWVKVWEKRFGDKPQASEQDIDHCEGTEQVVDHSIPIRYDHLISTEELVKRAQERWPDDGWDEKMGEPIVGSWGFGEGGDEGILRPDNDKGKTAYNGLRTKLLTLIGEVKVPLQSDKTIPKLPLIEDTRTKAERFYTFLATPQPDISPGLWGVDRGKEWCVEWSNTGWPLETTGGFSSLSTQACGVCLGSGWYLGEPCDSGGCQARY